jgi:predicted DNA-binding transcriptional regulator YafY
MIKRTRTTQRAQNKTRRVLILIDTLAPLRMPFTAADAARRLEDRNEPPVHERTIIRDLELFVLLGLAVIVDHGGGSNGYARFPRTYRMNLRLTERAEIAAIKICDRVTA